MLGPLKPKIEKMKSLKSAALNPKSKKRKVKKEKDSPMLLMRAPPPPRGYSVRRVLDLSKPKVANSTYQGTTVHKTYDCSRTKRFEPFGPVLGPNRTRTKKGPGGPWIPVIGPVPVWS